MKLLRSLLALSALLCLAGWIWLRKPYSPTDDLPPVAYTAFELGDPSEGSALAQTTKQWPGITAASFNENSRLLVLSHTLNTPAETLLARLRQTSAGTVQIKVFPEPTGPKCPVPQQTLAAIPGVLLKTGIGAIALFLLLFFFQRFRKSEISI